MDNIYIDLKSFGRVKLNENIAKHTTFKIGGNSRYFLIIDNNDKLVKALNYLTGQGIEYHILGGGSNILFGNDFDGVIIKIQTKGIITKGEEIIVEAGVSLGLVVSTAAQNSLSDMEWGIGIPGTVGGAVRGNAGAFGEDISQNVDKIEVYRDGEVMELSNKECGFFYRGSIFKDNSDVILKVYLKFKKGEKQKITTKMSKFMDYRTGRFAPFPSAGSFFKNLPLDAWKRDKKELPPKFLKVNKVAAGWLIDECGLRGYAIGGAKISDEHANFLVNYNKASFDDVMQLVEEVKEKVYNKFGIELEEEVAIMNN